jgi:hypothetical protein
MGTAFTNWYVVTTQQASPSLQWNTQYNCRVRAKVGGLWGNFSNSCRIGLRENPAVTGVNPTQLRAPFCNASNLAISSIIACQPVSMANNYEYEFTDLGNAQVTLKQHPNNYLPLNTVNPALQNGHQYAVKVRAYVYNTWSDWGGICNISLANAGANAREYSVDIDEEGNETLLVKEIKAEIAFELNAYPNPFNLQGGFNVISSDEIAMVYLYDAIGNLVWQEQVKTNAYHQFSGVDLSIGMYLLTAVDKTGNSKSLRLLKTE